MFETIGCSPYDLEFVWFAMEKGASLITGDEAIVRAFPDVAIDFRAFGKQA